MKSSKSLMAICTVILFLVIQSCKNNDTGPVNPEEDTRLLVKEAYSRMDVMKVTVAFNEQRANIMKTNMDAETDPGKKINMALEYTMELLRCGRTEETIQNLNAITTYIQDNKLEMGPETVRNLYGFIGITYMRHGEIENCVKNHNHQSCHIPIKGEGVHTLPYGSRNAIQVYEKCLKDFPDDLETKYLLNLAYQTLGEYPSKVPKQYLIDPSWYKNKITIPAFHDIAPQLGLNRNGHAGGVVIDDFTNDGWLDIVITSWNTQENLIFYINNGDGTFSDQTQAYGLDGQVGILNLNQTDYNNDGWLDLFLMRGGWYQSEGDIPCTLMMNTGEGSFRDVTIKAGITHVAPRQTSAWADFNLDGWLDLVMGNESFPGFERGIDLYINQKNGKFIYESANYGLTDNKFFKGCVATDVNNDRYPDLYFSALDALNPLYINQGNSGNMSFINVEPQAQVGAPLKSFPCWSFDFNNDGNEDLFSSGYNNTITPATQWMLSHMGQADPAMFPKLYLNKGNLQFEEVGVNMGLTEVAFTMGCNFGDINSDGFLDFYLSTGNPLYQALVPNKMYLNMEGQRFEDVSYVGGFANIQKGHGVSFADLDHDGDEDLYVVIGGAFEGDNFYNVLYENPNYEGNNWVTLKLTGVSANKAAIGARVTLLVQENGQERKICRTVTSGASFGANSLALEVGLRKATAINSVTVQWPCKECPDQTFTGLEINKAYELIQDSSVPKLLQYNKVKLGGGEGHERHTHH